MISVDYNFVRQPRQLPTVLQVLVVMWLSHMHLDVVKRGPDVDPAEPSTLHGQNYVTPDHHTHM